MHVDISQHTVRENGFRAWLEKMKSFLQRSFGGSYKLTPHAVQFKYDGKIDVDLLLSPYWSDPDQLYKFLGQIPEAKRSMLVTCIVCHLYVFDVECCTINCRFSVSASKWQVEFFQNQPNQVSDT